jgi:hypothetical protein
MEPSTAAPRGPTRRAAVKALAIGAAAAPAVLRGRYRLFAQSPQDTEGLIGRGHTDADIRLMLGGNWIRVLREIWGA